MSLLQNVLRFLPGLRLRARRFVADARIWQLTRQVLAHRRLNAQAPVVFFNASTRLNGVSQNAAFSLLASLGLQLAGVPVVHFACHAGMSRCVLGAAYFDPTQAPPCKNCIAQTRPLLLNGPVIPFRSEPNPGLVAALQGRGVDEMAGFCWPVADLGVSPSAISQLPSEIPLGALVLPTLRWVLRRHHLNDDAPTRALFREFIVSAASVARHFDALLVEVQPQAVIVFNGQFFPEATARWLAGARGVRAISHEVGLRPFTAFFTEGEATAYPLDIPDDFELDEAQSARLDEYLSQRFQGQFSMAGVRFWSGMSGLDEAFLARAAGFKQIVPVFTNVIFDTSQPHSNVVFAHMFAWLDLVLDLASRNPETLFVLRAHPDETRPGKESHESVAQWVQANRAADLPNVVFIDSRQTLSSYDLIRRSKFVMIYNSTIGLEASILGAAVLCGGRARFTQLPTVFFPQTVDDYRRQAEAFLAAERIAVPAEFERNARRFLYVQLFLSSLPFEEFIEEDGIWPGFVRLKPFPWERLRPEHSPAMQAIVDGVLHGGNFLLKP
ncbi:MAG: hypothetical protein ACOYYS_02020 [Chloroflexota bacterium]